QGAIGAGRIVLAAGGARADQLLLRDAGEQFVRVDARGARLHVDVLDDVLLDRLPRPEELAGLAVERIDEARLSRDAGDDLADLARTHTRVDPANRVPVRRHRRLDQ